MGRTKPPPLKRHYTLRQLEKEISQPRNRRRNALWLLALAAWAIWLFVLGILLAQLLH